MTVESQIILSLTLYKIISLIIGLISLCMGYRLFTLGINTSAGNLTADGGKFKLSLTGAPSGTFFAVLGTGIICFTLYQGLEIQSESPKYTEQQMEENTNLPDKSPIKDTQ